jgi:hypothetical protein
MQTISMHGYIFFSQTMNGAKENGKQKICRYFVLVSGALRIWQQKTFKRKKKKMIFSKAKG